METWIFFIEFTALLLFLLLVYGSLLCFTMLLFALFEFLCLYILRSFDGHLFTYILCLFILNWLYGLSIRNFEFVYFDLIILYIFLLILFVFAYLKFCICFLRTNHFLHIFFYQFFWVCLLAFFCICLLIYAAIIFLVLLPLPPIPLTPVDRAA